MRYVTGAGKTITADLYIKELMLRSDVERSLIVVPGPSGGAAAGRVAGEVRPHFRSAAALVRPTSDHMWNLVATDTCKA